MEVSGEAKRPGVKMCFLQNEFYRVKVSQEVKLVRATLTSDPSVYDNLIMWWL